jgi:hypothetical protein
MSNGNETTVQERVERDETTTVIQPAATPENAATTKEPPKKARRKKKARKTEPAAPVKKRRTKKVASAPKKRAKKNWRSGRKWPTQHYSLHVEVLTKKPKALTTAINKVLREYTVTPEETAQ